jgi:hypothetical protein
MNVGWVRSNEVLLAFLAVAIAAVGGLTVLVVHQQDDQTIGYEQVKLDTGTSAAIAPKASAPAPAKAPAPPVAPEAVPALQAAPAQVIPAPQVNPASQANPTPQVASAPRRSLPQARPHKLTVPVAPPRQPAPIPPAIPAPAADVPGKELPPGVDYRQDDPDATRTPSTSETAPVAGEPVHLGHSPDQRGEGSDPATGDWP